jgi:hypothetical protein
MGVRNVMAYIKNRQVADTPDTSAKNVGYQEKPLQINGDTPDTSDTSKNINSREIFQTRPFSEAVNDSTSTGRHGLQKPAPGAPAKRLKYLEWADGWIELDKAYQRHHWSCPQCQAAGRRANGLRCGVGVALYRAYEDASADRSALDW